MSSLFLHLYMQHTTIAGPSCWVLLGIKFAHEFGCCVLYPKLTTHWWKAVGQDTYREQCAEGVRGKFSDRTRYTAKSLAEGVRIYSISAQWLALTYQCRTKPVGRTLTLSSLKFTRPRRLAKAGLRRARGRTDVVSRSVVVRCGGQWHWPVLGCRALPALPGARKFLEATMPLWLALNLRVRTTGGPKHAF